MGDHYIDSISIHIEFTPVSQSQIQRNSILLLWQFGLRLQSGSSPMVQKSGRSSFIAIRRHIRAHCRHICRWRSIDTVDYFDGNIGQTIETTTNQGPQIDGTSSDSIETTQGACQAARVRSFGSGDDICFDRFSGIQGTIRDYFLVDVRSFTIGYSICAGFE